MKTAGHSWVKRRHQFFHDLLYYPIKLLFFLLYGFRGEVFPRRRGGQPCLVLSNHTSPLDCICLGLSFDFILYYVASDHIFRLGWPSSLLRFLVEPIPIMKSRLDLQAIKDMLRIISEGGSVCIFPEGNRNFYGQTGPMSPAIAKLAKQLKVPLVLYHIIGGYMTTPRWANGIRRGRMTGKVARVLSVEQMGGMTADELHAVITAELYENDYDRQRSDPVVFRSKAPAEYLERALYLCPACGEAGSLKSRKDRFFCTCGLEVRMNGFGFFEAVRGSLPFKSVLEWSAWQQEHVGDWLERRLLNAGPDEPLMHDDCEEFLSADRARRNERIGTGRLALYTDRLRLAMQDCSLDFPLSTLQKVVVTAKQTIQFTTDGGDDYIVRSRIPRSPLKYLDIIELLKKRDREVPNEFLG